ncbi:protein transport protein sec31-like [Parus major]|uniref:protein transport protein sec31-like n=1 Tax=Parus major TaxID=9157 RepID=UPI0014439128|nr:protein transport protein sec31-like [Parus major]
MVVRGRIGDPGREGIPAVRGSRPHFPRCDRDASGLDLPRTAQGAAHARCPPGLPALARPEQTRPAAGRATAHQPRGEAGAALPALTAAICPGPEAARARIVRPSALHAGPEPHNIRRRYGCLGTNPAWVRAVPAPAGCQRGRMFPATAAPSDPPSARRQPCPSGQRSAAEIDTVTASPRPPPATGGALEQR